MSCATMRFDGFRYGFIGHGGAPFLLGAAIADALALSWLSDGQERV